MFRGKKYKKVAEAFDRAQAYGLEQALEILKKSEVKFDQTVELHFQSRCRSQKLRSSCPWHGCASERYRSSGSRSRVLQGQ